MSRKTELAWAAGFFDGEGCTSATCQRAAKGAPPEGYIQVVMHVVQVGRETLDRFTAAVEIGHVTGPYKRGPNQDHDFYYWRAGSTGPSRKAFERLKPYLSPPKIAQAERAFAKYDNRPELPRFAKRRRVLELRDKGLTPKAIADGLGMTRAAVYHHLQTAAKQGAA